MIPILWSLLIFPASFATTEGELPANKCYSCSSPQLHLRWPKDDDNELQYLRDFPWYANESCDQVKNLLPVVDCPDSVCIKAVIKEAPAKREVCLQGGAVVRDCWSRVMHLNDYGLQPPKSKKDYIRLTDDIDSENTVGVIYTCEGYLCNSENRMKYYIVCPLSMLFFLLLL